MSSAHGRTDSEFGSEVLSSESGSLMVPPEPLLAHCVT